MRLPHQSPWYSIVLCICVFMHSVPKQHGYPKFVRGLSCSAIGTPSKAAAKSLFICSFLFSRVVNVLLRFVGLRCCIGVRLCCSALLNPATAPDPHQPQSSQLYSEQTHATARLPFPALTKWPHPEKTERPNRCVHLS